LAQVHTLKNLHNTHIHKPWTFFVSGSLLEVVLSLPRNHDRGQQPKPSAAGVGSHQVVERIPGHGRNAHSGLVHVFYAFGRVPEQCVPPGSVRVQQAGWCGARISGVRRSVSWQHRCHHGTPCGRCETRNAGTRTVIVRPFQFFEFAM